MFERSSLGKVVPKPVQPHSAADIRGLEIPLDLQFKAAASPRIEALHLGFANAGSPHQPEPSCERQNPPQRPNSPRTAANASLKVTAACPAPGSGAPRGLSAIQGCWQPAAGSFVSFRGKRGTGEVP